MNFRNGSFFNYTVKRDNWLHRHIVSKSSRRVQPALVIHDMFDRFTMCSIKYFKFFF